MSYKCKAVPAGKDVVWLKTVVNIDSTTRMSAPGHFGHGNVEWPKGTITWNPVDGECSDYAEELIAIAQGRKSHPNTIHPENNRYCANMPVELFDLLYTNPSDYIKGTKVMAKRDCISGDESGPNPDGHKVKRGEVLIITNVGCDPRCFWFADTPAGYGHFLPKDFIIIGKPGQYATEAALTTGTKLVAKKRAATKKSTTSDAIKPANEVEVGDTVRIIKSSSNWNEEMDEYVGQEVVVTKVSRYGSDAVIDFEDSGHWSWCSDNRHFIVIKNAQPTQAKLRQAIVPADRVQVGDIVLITKSSENWNSHMNDYIGREVVVTAVHPDPYEGVRILFDRSGGWSWCSRNKHYVVISRAISGPGVVSDIDTPTKPEGSPIRVSTATVSPIRIPTPITAQPKKVTRIIVEV